MSWGCYGTCAVSADLSAKALADEYEDALEELEAQLSGEYCADLFGRAPSIQAAAVAAGGNAYQIRDPLLRRAAIALQDAAEECARDEARRRMGSFKPSRRAA